MSNLGRSCLKLLVVYAIGAALIGVAVYHRFPVRSVAAWSGVIAGFFLWLTLAYLWAIPSNLLDWRRLRPGAPLRDGKRVGVVGPIHNAGATLHSPFTKTPCVAYYYTVMNYEGENPTKDFEGFGLVPSYVHTEQGQVRILAHPELEVPEEPVRGQEVKKNAEEYLAATTFTNTRQLGFKGLSEEMKKLAADDDGSIRYDYRVDPVASDLGKCKLTEKVLRAGETVCAIGKYSEERKALVTDPTALLHAVTIRKGDAGALRSKPLRKAIGSVFGVVICGGLLAAAALLFLVNFPMDASEQMNPKRKFLWEEVKLERWLEKKVRMPLVQSGTLNQQGMYFLQDLCTGCATGKLEANGRVLELGHASGWEDDQARVIHLAAREGEKDGVTITFDKRKKPVSAAVGYPWTITVTMNGTPFAVPADWTIPTDVQTSLTSDEVFNGRVTVMDPSDAVRVRASFKAPLIER